MQYVYILRRADDSFYIGSTEDLDSRLKAHNDGRGAAASNFAEYLAEQCNMIRARATILTS